MGQPVVYTISKMFGTPVDVHWLANNDIFFYKVIPGEKKYADAFGE